MNICYIHDRMNIQELLAVMRLQLRDLSSLFTEDLYHTEYIVQNLGINDQVIPLILRQKTVGGVWSCQYKLQSQDRRVIRFVTLTNKTSRNTVNSSQPLRIRQDLISILL